MAKDKILEFCEVSTAPLPPQATGMSNVTFALGGGDLALFLVEGESDSLSFCDLAEGLIEPDKGTVSFMAQDWRVMPVSLKEEMRGKIGRVFERDGWVSNLNVRENIELSERHHTLRSDSAIRKEAEQLCSFTGLPTLLDQRPDFLNRSVLRRAEWVRAFLGKHSLLLLEHPESEVSSEFLPKLIELIAGAREQQSAVVWITSDREIWSNRNFIDGSRFKITNGQVTQVQEV